MNTDQLPARPALAAVLEAVDGITDVAEAWEILDARGLLPPEGRRSFDVGVSLAPVIRNAPPRDTNIGGSRGAHGFVVHEVTARNPFRVSYAIERGGIRRNVVTDDNPENERFTVEGALTAAAREWPHPATVPDLIAWASLGTEAILTAEALCGETCGELAQWDIPPCERIAWRVFDAHPGRGRRVARLTVNTILDADGTSWHRMDPSRPAIVRAARALWDSGLGLASVGAECVLCVPPVGEARDA